MIRSVAVYQHRSAHYLIFEPMGTFKGFGGYVSIEPLRFLPGDATPQAIGDLCVDLLSRSVATGYHIRDVEAYRAAFGDAESKEVFNKYLKPVRSTGALARRYARVAVRLTDGQKSWRLNMYQYRPADRSLHGGPETRVRIVEGPEKLAEALLGLLAKG